MLSAAILVGALIIGDSVKYSLMKIVENRLGKVQFALASGDRIWARRNRRCETHRSLRRGRPFRANLSRNPDRSGLRRRVSRGATQTTAIRRGV